MSESEQPQEALPPIPPPAFRRGDVGIAAGLALAMVAIVCLTSNHYGVTYDEGWYVSGSIRARRWVGRLFTDPGGALSDSGLTRDWAASRRVSGGAVIHEQQPGGAKLVDGLLGYPVGRLFGQTYPERAGTALFLGSCVAALYLLLAPVWGRVAAVAAVLALVTMPRIFAHAHLVALDVPVMSSGLVCICLMFWAVARRSTVLAILSGLAWGLAMSCKINALFVPLILAAWILAFHRRFALRAALCLTGGGVVGFLVSWPWLWRDTLPRLGEYIAFHTQHYRVAAAYFGTVSGDQPWHYPAVMTAITTPPLTLLLALAGAALIAGEFRRPKTEVDGPAPLWRRSQALLLLLAVLLNIAFNSLPSAPKYNGVRLFLPFFPFVAAFAGIAVSRIVFGLTGRLRQGLGTFLTPGRMRGLVAALVFLPAVYSTLLLHPFQLSYYNRLIGGSMGAIERGMDVTYWGEAYSAATNYVIDNARPGDVIWVDLPGCEWIVSHYLELAGVSDTLSAISGGVPPAEASWAIVQNKESELRPETRALVASGPPRFPVSIEGALLCAVYDRAGIDRVFPQRARTTPVEEGDP